MKKTRLFSVAVVLLTLCMLLASCGSGAKPSDIYAKDFKLDETPTLKSGKVLDLTSEVLYFEGDVAFLYGDDHTYRFYNLATDTIVLEWKDTDSSKLLVEKSNVVMVGDETMFYLVKENKVDGNTELSTAFYDAKGAEITSMAKESAPTVNADFLVIEDRYFRYEEGAFVLKFERSKLSQEIPTFTYWSEELYYAVGENDVVIYTVDGQYLNAYVFPIYAKKPFATVLSSGDLLVQYVVELPEDASNYDVYENAKLDLISIVYNPKNGKTTNVDLDFMVTANIARGVAQAEMSYSDYEDIAKGINNMAIILMIEDKRIDSQNMMTASINNKGGLKKVLSNTHPNQIGAPVIPVAPDRFNAPLKSGNTVLMDQDGKVIGEISNLEEQNFVFLIADDRVYNMDMQFVYDFGEGGFKIHQILDYAIIFSNADGGVKYYIMTKDMTAPTELAITSETEYYYIVKDGDSYVYYNECGEEILRSEYKGELVGASVDSKAVLLKSKGKLIRLTSVSPIIEQ